MRLIKEALARRKEPVQIAMIGCGWWGAGVARYMLLMHGMSPRLLVDTDINKCVRVLQEAGVPPEQVLRIERAADVRKIRDFRHAVTTEPRYVEEMPDDLIDGIHEATGEVLPAALAALMAIRRGIPFTTVSAEMDATVGLILAKKAAKGGVLYTNTDGDQPGCLARMLDDIMAWGFEPRVVGNNKLFLDPYQTPAGVLPWVPAGGNPHMLSSAADGSKLALELSVVANAYNFPPLRRGMIGPRTTKADLVASFQRLADLDRLDTGHIDYTLGTTEPDMGGPVFVIARADDSRLRADMKHYKKGAGPYYIFFRDHHLGSIEAPATIAEAVLFNSPALCPKSWCSDVITVAKRSNPAGTQLDGLGGYDYYGLADTAEAVRRDELLPIGLAQFATLTHDVRKDELITRSMVDLQENLAVELRREQDALPPR